MEKELISVGKVSRAHGIKGRFIVVPYDRSGEGFRKISRIFLRSREGGLRECRVQSAAPYKKWFLLQVEGWEKIEDVEKFLGAEVLVDKEDLPEVSEGEYYCFDIIGMKVITEEGRGLGEVQEIIATGSNDVYVTRDDSKEYLIPAIDEVVLKVDLNKREIIIRPKEGLL
ncbi:MAG: 16S rRNA processing protein RimM [Deltaproteobacteria bacterium]|nr:MAG: 16S rRNA processing protein RimM [Deltaproteobacteria bacterium]